MISALETILRHPRTVMIMMFMILGFGIATYIAIPKESDPDIDVPVFYVSVSQQGVSAHDAERLLVRPLETSLRSLEGLKEITGIASEGHAGIVLEFDISFDKDKAMADVRDKVDQAKAQLPADADEPSISETNFSLQPTLRVTLSGPVTERVLYQHALRLQDEIETISTVLEAELAGHREEVLEVIIDQVKLESYNITQAELINAVTQNHKLIPAGFVDNGNGRFNIKVPGLIETPEDVYSIPIKQNGEAVITLGNISEIRKTFKDPTTFTRVNGRPAIVIAIKKRIGTNIIKNNLAVREVVKNASKDWPETIIVGFMLDEAKPIFEILGSLQSSIMTAIFLVMIVVVAALGLKSALLIGFAIPTSFMTGFLILGSIGMTVNVMVMFGLVLTVGMLVDGAIVVVEYADRKMAEGDDPQEAYIRAAKLMFWPIVSSTATTLAAFLPMLMWPGVAGQFMSFLPIMVIIVLSASLLTALIFLPVTGALVGRALEFINRTARKSYPLMLSIVPTIAGFIAGMAFGKELRMENPAALAMLSALVVFALSFVIFIVLFRNYKSEDDSGELTHDQEIAQLLSGKSSFDHRKLGGLTGIYAGVLKFFTTRLIGNILALGIVAGFCFFAFTSFMNDPKGVEFFVDEEPRLAMLYVSARGNMSATEARDIVVRVEERILGIKGIKDVVTTSHPSGAGGGGVSIGGGGEPEDMIGNISFELSDYCCRRKATEIFAEMREATSGFPGIKVEIAQVQGGPPTGKDVIIQIDATSYEKVTQATAIMRAHFDSYSTLHEIEDSRPLPGIEWKLEIDREQAGRYNTNIAQVGAMVQLVTNGLQIAKPRLNGSDEEVAIRIRLPEASRSLENLDTLRINTPNGLVPLSNFVTRTPQAKVNSIVRRDGYYSMKVRASLTDAAKEGDKDNNVKALTPDDMVKSINKWVEVQDWGTGVFVKFTGADEDQKESQAFLANAAIAALLLMFLILLTQFNSFYQTILTLSTVVMSVFGVLLGMAITGQKFSIIMTGTGVVALAGIVVNNAIVLIDTYNRFHRIEGVPIQEAILKTAAQRIRPILLTTITTMAGLVPMAAMINFNFFDRIITTGGITATWWVQLSTAVIAGLGFSTILTLLFIPVMLSLPTVFMGSMRAFGGFVKRLFSKAATAETLDSSTVDKPAINDSQNEVPVRLPNVAKLKAANDQVPVALPEAAE